MLVPPGNLRQIPAFEIAAPAKQVLRTTCKFSRRTPVRELHIAFKVPYIYDCITKLCRQQVEVTQNHENANVPDIRTGEARHKKYKRLKLGGDHSSD
jgi:hypothetical protein